MKTHYVGQIGLGGCIPNFCGVYATKKLAIDSLGRLSKLSRRQQVDLRKFGIAHLRKDQGNEYAEIVECDCSEPGRHQDEMSNEEFREECPEFYEVEENCEICRHSNDCNCPYPVGCPQK